MRRLTCACVAVLGLLIGVGGCGSDSGDQPGGGQLTLRFMGFNSDGITQADTVSQSSADVDVCPDICGTCSTSLYTQTSINAVLMNVAKADIYLDSYTLSVPPSTGVPDTTRAITVFVPGGRCKINTAVACTDTLDCPGLLEACVHTETTVNVLLYDLDFKDRIKQGTCPGVFQDTTSGQCFNGENLVIPQTLNAFLIFSGVDLADHRFEVSANYVTTFANFAGSCGG